MTGIRREPAQSAPRPEHPLDGSLAVPRSHRSYGGIESVASSCSNATSVSMS